MNSSGAERSSELSELLPFWYAFSSESFTFSLWLAGEGDLGGAAGKGCVLMTFLRGDLYL